MLSVLDEDDAYGFSIASGSSLFISFILLWIRICLIYGVLLLFEERFVLLKLLLVFSDICKVRISIYAYPKVNDIYREAIP